MVKILDVYFHQKIIGQLEQDNHGDITFAYSSSWLFDPQAVRISCSSLPLQKTIIRILKVSNSIPLKTKAGLNSFRNGETLKNGGGGNGV